MTSKEIVLNIMRNEGRTQGIADALDLRSRAIDMDATAIIAEGNKVPLFVPGKDYSAWPKGSPVAEIVDGEVQIFTMITPVNTAHYPNITPNTERSLFSLCHSKDPNNAKPFVAPLGTSGLYSKDECCTDPNFEDPTQVFISKVDNNAYRPSEYMQNWEKYEA